MAQDRIQNMGYSDIIQDVLIVDDHPVVRHGYRVLLEGDGRFRVVAEASDARQAYLEYCRKGPDLVIMDISLPRHSGLDVTKRIVQRDPDANILIFSIHDSAHIIQRARKAGAKGFLCKNIAPEKLIEALLCIAGGGTFFDIPGEGSMGDVGCIESLSPREFEVFLLLAKGYSVKEISDFLSISAKTAGVHQTRIMGKLGATNAAQLTLLAIRAGLLGDSASVS